MKIEVKETSKEDAKREEEWKVEDAMHTLMEYQKILENKELKKKAIEKLRAKAKDFEKIADKLD